jgi:hypothetical protein
MRSGGTASQGRHRKIMAFVGVALGAYALLVGAAYLGQRFILYPAPPFAVTPDAPEATLERIEVPGAAPTLALHFAAVDGAPTIVHFHGNGEQLADLVALGRRLRSAGLGVLHVEYPGYGLVGGSPSEDATYAAAEAALVHLKSRYGVADDRIVLQGQSLGCGIAVEMAARGHGSRLILISPFTSVVDVGKKVMPIVPVGLLVRDRYDNAAKAPRVGHPALVIHGTRDRVVPFEMGSRLSALLPHARLVTVPGGGHNDLFARSAAPVLSAIVEFARGD